MKEFLGQILEPGETLVWRDPTSIGLIGPVFYTLQPILIALLFTGFGRGAENPEVMWRAFWLFLPIGLIYGATFYLPGRWKIAVTDRRVMQRKGFWRIGFEEMPRDAIEDVKNDIPTVVLRGDGREMRIDAGGEAYRLHALLTEAKKTTAALEPGETVTLRIPGRWRPWRVMVTDRRVIHRLTRHPPEIMQMRLDEIADVRRDTVFHAVLLRGADQDLTLRLNAGDTARLLETLGHPAWDELPLDRKGQT